MWEPNQALMPGILWAVGHSWTVPPSSLLIGTQSYCIVYSDLNRRYPCCELIRESWTLDNIFSLNQGVFADFVHLPACWHGYFVGLVISHSFHPNLPKWIFHLVWNKLLEQFLCWFPWYTFMMVMLLLALKVPYLNHFGPYWPCYPLQIEPSGEWKLDGSNTRVAGFLILAISTSLKHEKYSHRISPRMFEYATAFFGRISHALGDVLDRHSLLAYLSHGGIYFLLDWAMSIPAYH